MYLAAAPLGLIWNVVKATIMWPWVCYQRFNGYRVPFENMLRSMCPGRNSAFWTWERSSWF